MLPRLVVSPSAMARPVMSVTGFGVIVVGVAVTLDNLAADRRDVAAELPRHAHVAGGEIIGDEVAAVV